MSKKINLFIIGMQKAGTTSIFNFLCKSSKISHTKIKETNYFSDKIFIKDHYDLNNLHSNFLKNEFQLNNNIFKKKNSTYFLEGSVNHFYSKNAPKKILKYNPDAKFILIIRDPIHRIISHYLMDLNLGINSYGINKSILHELRNNDSYGSDLGYLKMSFIKKNYENWCKYFPKDKILIINFENFKNQNLIKKKLSDFLSLNLYNFELNFDNKSRAPRFIRLNKLITNARRFLPFSSNLKFLKKIYNLVFFSNIIKNYKIEKNIQNELIHYFKDDYDFLKKNT